MVQNTCKIYYTNSGSSKRNIEINIGTYVEFSIKEDTRRQRGVEPDPRTFKRDLQQIIPQGFKGYKQDKSYPLVCEFSQKI